MKRTRNIVVVGIYQRNKILERLEKLLRESEGLGRHFERATAVYPVFRIARLALWVLLLQDRGARQRLLKLRQQLRYAEELAQSENAEFGSYEWLNMYIRNPHRGSGAGTDLYLDQSISSICMSCRQRSWSAHILLKYVLASRASLHRRSARAWKHCAIWSFIFVIGMRCLMKGG